MMLRAAVAFLALALPAVAQHGGSHAGSSGSRGFSGHAGFSSQPSFSRPAFSQSPSFTRPAQPAHYGSSYGLQYRPMPGAEYRAVGPQNYSTLRTPYNGSRYIGSRNNGTPYNGNQQSPARAPYNPAAATLSRSSDPYHDRDRFDARRRQFQNWHVNTFQYWSGYPYLLNPNFYNLGLYDWNDSDNSAPSSYEPSSYEPSSDESASSQPGSYPSDQGYDQNGPAPDYPPYPNQGYYPPNQIASAATGAPASTQPLTVIFKSGRSPIEIQNYLITAKVLTDLDSQHYEQIPLDEINLAATQNFNKVAGVDFQVPFSVRGPSRD